MVCAPSDRRSMPENKTRVFQTIDRHKTVKFSSLDSDKAFDVASEKNKQDPHAHWTVVSYVLDERED